MSNSTLAKSRIANETIHKLNQLLTELSALDQLNNDDAMCELGNLTEDYRNALANAMEMD